MKRSNIIYQYGHAFRQEAIIEKAVPCSSVRPDVDVPVTAADSFISLVYALDERTRLPLGDLTFMVSDKVNPEIKKWVLDNLLFDTSSAAMPSPPSGVSDDDIAKLTRQSGESAFDYYNRLRNFASDNFEIYNLYLNNANQQGQSVSPEPAGTAVPSE